MTYTEKHYPTIDRCKRLETIGYPLKECRNPFAKYEFPTIPELLDIIILPLHHKLEIKKQYDFDDWYWYKVEYHNRDWLVRWFQDESLANALTDLIFWLNENNYISFPR